MCLRSAGVSPEKFARASARLLRRSSAWRSSRGDMAAARLKPKQDDMMVADVMVTLIMMTMVRST